MTLLLPEFKYKYLHFKTPWLQPVNLSQKREGDRRVRDGVRGSPHLKEMGFKVIKPLLL